MYLLYHQLFIYLHIEKKYLVIFYILFICFDTDIISSFVMYYTCMFRSLLMDEWDLNDWSLLQSNPLYASFFVQTWNVFHDIKMAQVVEILSDGRQGPVNST